MKEIRLQVITKVKIVQEQVTFFFLFKLMASKAEHFGKEQFYVK